MAASNEVTVNLAAVDSLIAHLESFGSELGAQVRGLEQQIAALHSHWFGDAAQAHSQAHAEWARGMELMDDGLQRIRAASANAHSAFSTTVAANRALFS